jgi:acetamidase/formamidase
VLDPGFQPRFDDDFEGTARWTVDVAAGTVHLAEPEGALSKLKLPLDPMVGCFGVAPSRGQAISTATSERHGGNMDYRGFRQGVKVYFPVFAPGALFHIGDGHAVQGDGEIVGTGVEISFDVRFTVDLVKGSSIGWPRAEDDTWLMAVGNARPLDQCVQHATTEMLGWLEAEHGLDARTAHMLLGQAVAYDVGNIYDPAYTMVCKMRKEHVAAVR